MTRLNLLEGSNYTNVFFEAIQQLIGRADIVKAERLWNESFGVSPFLTRDHGVEFVFSDGTVGTLYPLSTDLNSIVELRINGVLLLEITSNDYRLMAPHFNKYEYNFFHMLSVMSNYLTYERTGQITLMPTIKAIVAQTLNVFEENVKLGMYLNDDFEGFDHMLQYTSPYKSDDKGRFFYTITRDVIHKKRLVDFWHYVN